MGEPKKADLEYIRGVRDSGKTYTVPMAHSDLHQGRGLIYSQRCRLLTREQTPCPP